MKNIVLIEFEKGSIEIANKLLSDDIDANHLDSNNYTPLIWAVRHGEGQFIANLLLKHNDIDVNKPDSIGITPLIWAAINNKYKIVELLLKHDDIDVNRPDNFGNTALIWASVKKNIKTTPILIYKLIYEGAKKNSIIVQINNLKEIKLSLEKQFYEMYEFEFKKFLNHTNYNFDKQISIPRQSLRFLARKVVKDETGIDFYPLATLNKSLKILGLSIDKKRVNEINEKVKSEKLKNDEEQNRSSKKSVLSLTTSQEDNDLFKKEDINHTSSFEPTSKIKSVPRI